MKHYGLTTDMLELKVGTLANYKCLKRVTHLTGLHGKITRPRHEGHFFIFWLLFIREQVSLNFPSIESFFLDINLNRNGLANHLVFFFLKAQTSGKP